MPADTATLLVLTTMPDRAAAMQLARHLVEQRLAACVSLGAPMQSIYRWQGVVAESAETPVQIKTSSVAYAAVEAAIRALHPYELPEIIAVPVVAGLPAYLNWVHEESTPPNNA
ncbi:divalent-cation tolerance protein CutA [uncultured Oxalicibacterium sp.]|uniref:divalent-cation tolerance protein CutA n=1 Tax=uncultured Oxalicibacterium sp. TaxID=1168540 RepID=UPI0025F7F009|nr:divalent-cation tolerance protein CutA [uncultured Oxalicibacterium sp.]